jgi:hypothetical protein
MAQTRQEKNMRQNHKANWPYEYIHMHIIQEQDKKMTDDSEQSYRVISMLKGLATGLLMS